MPGWDLAAQVGEDRAVALLQVVGDRAVALQVAHRKVEDKVGVAPAGRVGRPSAAMNIIWRCSARPH